MTTATLERPCGCPPSAIVGQKVRIMDGVTNAGAGGQRVHIAEGIGNWALGRRSQTVHIRPELQDCTYDEFDRVETSSLGTSTAGYTWTNQFSSGTYGVDGDVAYASNGGLLGKYNPFSLPFACDFVLTSRVRSTRTPSGADSSVRFLFRPENNAASDYQSVEITMEVISGVPKLRGKWAYSFGTFGSDGGTEELGSPTTGWYLLKWDTRSGFKVWLEGDPEPSTWLGVPQLSGLVAERFYFVVQSIGTSTAEVDYIRICPLNARLFDDFERTETSGGGTATPGGMDWQAFGTPSVDGHRAVLPLDSGLYTLGYPSLDPSRLNMFFDFQFSAAPSGGSYTLSWFPGNATTAEIALVDGTSFIHLAFSGGDSPAPVDVDVPSLDTGLWHGHLYTDLTSVRMSIWKDGASEPALWMGEVSTAVPVADPNPMYLWFENADDTIIYVDNIRLCPNPPA